MQLGQWEQAVLSLEPLAASKQFSEMLPRDLVGYELARARIAWATQTDLARETADIQLHQAIRELSGLKKTKPDRIHAAMRVAQGEAMAAVRGPDDKAIKAAAIKAEAALDNLITSFPNHPQVGEWMLERALAELRAGHSSEAGVALRRLAIVRAGEPEAARAWAELEQLAASNPTNKKIDAKPLSTGEQLEAGQAARTLRRLERSTELLEAVWNDPSQPTHRHREAGHSLAWTYYKDRKHGRCADVLAELYADVASLDTRSDLSRCLERAGRYDEAIDLWFSAYDAKKNSYGATALWNAIEIAVNGGRYQRALDLIDEFEKRYKSRGSDRRWLRAWLPMRLGDVDTARRGLADMLETHRTGGRERAAEYFLGKLELGSDDRELRLEGVHRLQRLVSEGTSAWSRGGHRRQPGLLRPARPPAPDRGRRGRWPAADPRPDRVGASRPSATPRRPSCWPSSRPSYSDSFSSIVRAEQLLAAGWREEASRELRVAVDEFINGRSVYDGGDMPGTRSEALVSGLAWAEEWRHPKAQPSRAARKAAARRGHPRGPARRLHGAVSWALDEPYRFAKLTSSATALSRPAGTFGPTASRSSASPTSARSTPTTCGR